MPDDHPEVSYASEDNLRRALNTKLRAEGWTFAQMKQLALDGDVRACMAWAAYGDLEHLAEA